MEQVKVICIADASDSTEETSFAEEARADVIGAWDAAEVGAVQMYGEEDGRGEEDGGDDVAWVAVVRPVRGVYGVFPGHGGTISLFIVGVGGFPWWPLHGCGERALREVRSVVRWWGICFVVDDVVCFGQEAT